MDTPAHWTETTQCPLVNEDFLPICGWIQTSGERLHIPLLIPKAILTLNVSVHEQMILLPPSILVGGLTPACPHCLVVPC